MKKTILTLVCGVITMAGVFAFTALQPSIVGKLTPAEGAKGIWAINGKDAVKAVITAGAFSIPVKTGTYKLVVHAKEPYKDVIVEKVEVKDQPVDIGEIVLQQ
jgi:hypothetical protein